MFVATMRMIQKLVLLNHRVVHVSVLDLFHRDRSLRLQRGRVVQVLHKDALVHNLAQLKMRNGNNNHVDVLGKRGKEQRHLERVEERQTTIGMKRTRILAGTGGEGKVNNVQHSKQNPVNNTTHNKKESVIPFHVLLFRVIPKNTQRVEHWVDRTQQVPIQ